MATRQDDDDVLGSAEDGELEAVDATELLKNDHDEVRQLFEEFESMCEEDAPDGEREDLARRICSLLTVHATLEEEIFYPAAREALDDDDLIDEAVVEHAIARDLIEQIESMGPSEDLYDAKVRVLGEYVRHHVQEEEDELFARLAETDLDLESLGAELAERRAELMADLGIEED